MVFDRPPRHAEDRGNFVTRAAKAREPHDLTLPWAKRCDASFHGVWHNAPVLKAVDLPACSAAGETIIADAPANCQYRGFAAKKRQVVGCAAAAAAAAAAACSMTVCEVWPRTETSDVGAPTP